MHQEGADNIDINTETVDGKNTFHSMARTVFQIRHYAVDPNISQSKKKNTGKVCTDQQQCIIFDSLLSI
jgi:hypothetical protein